MSTTTTTIPPRDGMLDDPIYRTAEEFLVALTPTSPRWTGRRWVFRGQANALWELKATGVRDPAAYERFGAPSVPPSATTPAWSRRREQQDFVLADFARRLDEAGAVIPTKSPRVNEAGESWSSDHPEPAVWPLMALAQHHGLPTLFLDWSRRARFAAYFAASDVIRGEGDPKLGTHLAVVALNIGDADGVGVLLPPRPGDGVREGSTLREYRAPGGTNPNLHAQAGVFTIQTNPDDSSVEKHLHRCLEEGRLKTCPLHRLILPHDQTRDLLKLLSLEGIDGASMFPGRDGVVRAMRERALWDRP